MPGKKKWRRNILCIKGECGDGKNNLYLWTLLIFGKNKQVIFFNHKTIREAQIQECDLLIQGNFYCFMVDNGIAVMFCQSHYFLLKQLQTKCQAVWKLLQNNSRGLEVWMKQYQPLVDNYTWGSIILFFYIYVYVFHNKKDKEVLEGNFYENSMSLG